ncbi:ATP-binding protein [Nocardiopsis sp. ARC36]
MQPTAPPPRFHAACVEPHDIGHPHRPHPSHVKAARQWAAHATRSRPGLTDPLALTVTELTTNALRHTASGLPGGTVRIEIHRTRRHLELHVTDNGPPPEPHPHSPPSPTRHPCASAATAYGSSRPCAPTGTGHRPPAERSPSAPSSAAEPSPAP